MNIHERLEAFWAGERPDQIPYTIYQNEWRHTQNDPAWEPMYAAGLGVTWHIPSWQAERTNLTVHDEEATVDGKVERRQVLQTPVGEVSARWVDGWQQKYYLETPADYRVMTYIAQHTTITPAYERFLDRQRNLPPFGVALVALGRTPLQTMLVDYAGLERFGGHLYDYADEVRDLYDALRANFRRTTEVVAAGPGRFVSNLENFTADSLGPRRYREFLLPVYNECFPLLHEAGKIVGCHYDGRTASCRHLIASAPIDLIESLTPPPEGDLTLAEARAVWPDKLFWSNLNVALYDLPPAELRQSVLARVAEAAPDGRRFAFEVSELYAGNWRESMPVVLEALKETRAA
jgi:hypothetical protein